MPSFFRALAEKVIDPLPWSILLLVAGLALWKRTRISRLLCLASLLLLWVFSSWSVSQVLLSSLENQYPDVAIDVTPRAQAIVVLGGSVLAPSPQHTGSALVNPSDRVLHASRLYHAGKAPLVVCSGGGPGGAEAPVMGQLLQEWGVPAEAILLEDRSMNTHENALFSYALLQARGIRQILLVTSATHMPRAMGAFRKAGFQVTASPADYRTGWGDSGGFFNPSGWIPEANDLMWSDRAVREWLGLMVYRVRGWS